MLRLTDNHKIQFQLKKKFLCCSRSGFEQNRMWMGHTAVDKHTLKLIKLLYCVITLPPIHTSRWESAQKDALYIFKR